MIHWRGGPSYTAKWQRQWPSFLLHGFSRCPCIKKAESILPALITEQRNVATLYSRLGEGVPIDSTSASIYIICICIAIHPSINPSVHPYIHSYTNLSIYRFIYLSVCPLICPSIYLLLHPSIYKKNTKLKRRLNSLVTTCYDIRNRIITLHIMVIL